ncbi:MAG: hypothetical protein LBC96_06765 [Lachnospiraceae bacterium]|nr:hypothetical protein [Lachnospiraceae bacterium]
MKTFTRTRRMTHLSSFFSTKDFAKQSPCAVIAGLTRNPQGERKQSPCAVIAGLTRNLQEKAKSVCSHCEA